MTDLAQELIDLNDEFFSGEYEIVDARVVPKVEDLKFGKFGKELELTMLFVDIRDSTIISRFLHRKTVARMYQTYLSGVSRIIRSMNGYIRSFNGDGVLAVFEEGTKNSNAAETALKISWFCNNVLGPKMNSYFLSNEHLKDKKFSYGIGIDTGEILVVRGGIKGGENNDLVWGGYATNRAVKLSGKSTDGFHVHISKQVYSKLTDDTKYENPKVLPKVDMWKPLLDLSNLQTVYRSNHTWKP